MLQEPSVVLHPLRTTFCVDKRKIGMDQAEAGEAILLRVFRDLEAMRGV